MAHEHTHGGQSGGQTNVLPLARLHLKHGWHPAPVHGWTLPLWYTSAGRGGVYDEHAAARSDAAIFDRSHLGRCYVTGEAAGTVLARALATDVRRLAPGQSARAVACREDGTILDLPFICRLDDARWLVITGPRGAQRIPARITTSIAPGEDVMVHDRMRETVLLEVAGPRSAERLEAVVGPTIPHALEPGEGRELLLGGYRAAVLRASDATPDTGEDGHWFLLSPEVGEQFWERAVANDTVPAGLAAHEVLRLEAGVLEAPVETPAPATPEAAGLGGLVDLDADRAHGRGPRDFPGAEALRAAGPPERRLTGLRLLGPRLAKPGARVSVDGRPTGACVAAVFSPALEAGIALAYLPSDAAGGPGDLEVDTDGVPQGAERVPLPFVAPAGPPIARR